MKIRWSRTVDKAMLRGLSCEVPILMEFDVEKIANLARIRLTDAEAAELGPQLVRILDYVDSLQKLDTADIEPTAHPHDAAMPLRADVATNPNRREALQKPAPATESGLYVVPKVIE